MAARRIMLCLLREFTLSRLFTKHFYAFFLLVSLPFVALPGTAQPLNVERLETALIFNFVRNIEWPDDKKIKAFSIGLLGDDELLYSELRQAATKVKIKNRSFKLKRLQTLSFDPFRFQIIVVSRDAADFVPDLASRIRSTNTLLITIGSENKQDFMINIIQPDAKHLSFEVNRSNIVYERLKMDKNILLLGGTELDVAELFRENERSLKQIKEELASRQYQLLALETDVKDKQLLLAEKNSQITRQIQESQEKEKKLLRQEQELAEKSALVTANERKLQTVSEELKGATNLLLDKQQVLKNSQELLDDNLEIIANREQKVGSLTAIIERNNRILEQQQVNLEKQEAELAKKSMTISQQRGWLLVFSVSLVIFTLLMGTILVIDRARKRSNEKLIQTLEELRMAKEDADTAKRQAEEASRSKGTFLANMSHEIRTPMNAILGFSELMQRERSVTDEQRLSLNIINNAGNHLLSLIDDVLDISKIESGQISVESSNFNLRQMLSEMEQMFRVRTDAKGLSLNFTGMENLPEFITSDEAKVRQILINLLGNAAKFTITGSIVCQADARRLEDDNFELTITIDDTGPGIADAEKSKVFATFEQTDAGRKVEGGTGLGMAISREYARLLGGDISFTSEYNVGTSFSLTLVAQLAKTTNMTHDQSEIIGVKTGQMPKKVLLVDDKVDNRSLVRKMLEPLGFIVTEACDGKQAVALFHEEQPDLILMDKRMPVMDGLEATRQIKATPAGEKTPIIAMTAHAFEEERRVILEKGADDFLRKPFRRHVLLTMIGKHLDLAYEYGDAQRPAPPVSQKPTHKATAAAKNTTEVQRIAKIGTVTEPTPGNGGFKNKILIVDDVKANRLLLKMMLTREGYHCEEAKNGIEALAMFEQWQPNIVLLDIQMPEMNGYEVLERVDAKNSKDFAPIIALTADNDSDEIMKLKSLGAKDVFSKPIVHDKLLASIRQQIAS